MIAILTGKPAESIASSRTISVPDSRQLQIEAGISLRHFAGSRPEGVACEQSLAVRIDTPEMAEFLAGMFTRAAELLRARTVQS